MDAKVRPMPLRFMSRGEIADYLGLDISTVKRWTNFPPPDVTVGRVQGWARDTVDAWCEATGRQPRRP